jgi:hypothetical protein
MIALALRRQRGALATVAGIVLLCAIGLVALFTGGYQFEGAPQLAVFCMPLLVGLITGTTLFAREFDNSAHHFTLTQSVRPTAWWASAVGVAAIATALAAGALSLLTSLMARGLAAGRPEPLWLYPPWFETTGTAAIAYALLAFSISATVGLLTRSTLAGVVTAMVAYIVVMLVLNSIRVDYLPAETVTTPLGRSDASPIPEGGPAPRATRTSIAPDSRSTTRSWNGSAETTPGRRPASAVPALPRSRSGTSRRLATGRSS